MKKDNTNKLEIKEARREFKRKYKHLGVNNLNQLIQAKESLEEELKNQSSDYGYKYELFILISQHIDVIKLSPKFETMYN